MNRSLKRTFAITAALPLAVIAAMGTAQADTDRRPDISINGVDVTAACWHDSIEYFGFKMVITREGIYGADTDDIDTVRVVATDAGSSDDSYDNYADAAAILTRVDLIRDDLQGVEDETNLVHPAFKTLADSSSGFSSDGDTTLDFSGANNIKYVIGRVEWSQSDGGGPEVLVCTVKLPRAKSVS